MTNFIETFKNRARNKNVTAADMLARCAVKAITSKADDKCGVFINLVRRSFSPGKIKQHRNHPYLALRQIGYDLAWQLREKRTWVEAEKRFVQRPGTLLGVDVLTLMSEEHYKQVVELISQFKYTDERLLSNG